MRGLALQNSLKTAIPAHLWPFTIDKNCDGLSPCCCATFQIFFTNIPTRSSCKVELQGRVASLWDVAPRSMRLRWPQAYGSRYP
jgi:hypothetical protein